MRYVVNIVALLFLAGAVGLALYFYKQQDNRAEQVARTRDAVRTISLEVKRQAGLKLGELGPTGFPLTVDPAWFPPSPPMNPLLGGNRPWVEVAAPEQSMLDHPVARCDLQGDLAAFWYNPANGIVRARVPHTGSDATTLTLYNDVNESNLTLLFPWAEAPPPRDDTAP